MLRSREWVPSGYTTGPLLVFVALLAADVVLKGGTFSIFDTQSLASNVLPLAMIGLGQFYIILTNGIDLSLGPVLSVASAVMATWSIGNTPLAIGAAIAVGMVAGTGNGFFVVRFGLPPIIVTLASMSVWDGVALLILPSPGGGVPAGLEAAYTTQVGPIPVTVILLVLVTLLAVWILHTRFGLYLRAIGGDEPAARTSGVPTASVKMGAYALGGMLAAGAGIMLTINNSSGSPIVGDSFVLMSIAAVVLGGVALVGGRGSAVGVVMGALILIIVGSLLYFANLSSFYQSMVNGAILILAVGAGAIRSRIWSRWSA